MDHFAHTPAAAVPAPTASTCARPHIVHIICQLRRGGAELQLSRMLPHIDQTSWKSTILTHWTGVDPQIAKYLAQSGCEVIQLGKRRHLDARFLWNFTRTMHRLRPDLVHAWLSPGALWVRLLKPILPAGFPVVVSYRGWQTHPFPLSVSLEKQLARATSAVICNSPGLQRLWAQRLDRRKVEVLMIPNGVDVEHFKPSPDRAGLRQALELPVHSLIVSMVGSMYPVKNWPMFVRAAARVCRQVPSVRFCAVGGGPRLAETQQLAEQAGLTGEQITFFGESARVAEVLAASDVFLFTSNSEGMPNAILEAMAAGLPIVGTEIDGVRALVRHDHNGLLVPVDDDEKAAECVLRLYTDRSLVERMGTDNRRQVLEQHTFSRMAAMHEEVYQRLLVPR